MMGHIAGLVLVGVLAGSSVAPVSGDAVPGISGGGVADTFEVRLQNAPVLRLEADELEYVQHGLAVLKVGGDTVGAFRMHQLIYIVNVSAQGSRTFELEATDGSSYRVEGDRLVPEQSSLIRIESEDGRLMGFVSVNYLKYILARNVRIGA